MSTEPVPRASSPVKATGVTGPDESIVEFEVPAGTVNGFRVLIPGLAPGSTPVRPLQRIPCPFDTNGDGDCGRRYCPHCGGA